MRVRGKQYMKPMLLDILYHDSGDIFLVPNHSQVCKLLEVKSSITETVTICRMVFNK